MNTDHDTIVASATAAGGAIAVIRISGGEAFAVCDRIFRGRRPLAEAEGYTVHYGTVADGDRVIDDVLAAVFRAPHSYTGENSVEISCHGSSYIVSEILRLLIAAGGRMAQPGEFTIRAYLAGKLDLSQAEAVADMIASSSRAAHALASTQMRGGYSEELESLREKLLNLTSLLELELDFSEEDVEFADRTALRGTMERIAAEIDRLRSSFALGNAIREGVAVAIAGAPNVGKSTLLNRLTGADIPANDRLFDTLDSTTRQLTVSDTCQALLSDTVGFIAKHNASIAGAEVGCQGEIGVASAMAAAFVADARGYRSRVTENAAEVALEHHLGITCDPVQGYVQIPCIERNAMGAIKAYNAAVITSGTDPYSQRVSLDAAIAAMAETGREMSCKFKETSLGGLAVSMVAC